MLGLLEEATAQSSRAQSQMTTVLGAASYRTRTSAAVILRSLGFQIKYSLLFSRQYELGI